MVDIYNDDLGKPKKKINIYKDDLDSLDEFGNIIDPYEVDDFDNEIEIDEDLKEEDLEIEEDKETVDEDESKEEEPEELNFDKFPPFDEDLYGNG